SLNQAAIKVSKNSARANVFMSTQLFNQYREESDQSKKLQLLDEAAPLINRALEIYPKYNDALTMKLGVAAEYFRMKREIDPLIKSFKEVAQIVPGHPYMFEYMDYLKSTGQYRTEMEDFFYSTGY